MYYEYTIVGLLKGLLMLSIYLFLAGSVFLLLSLLIRSILISLKLRFKLFEKFCCWIGWHWSTTSDGFDGVNIHGQCDSCKKKGLYDSNNDFFTIE